jgi:hypothetical protein
MSAFLRRKTPYPCLTDEDGEPNEVKYISRTLSDHNGHGNSRDAHSALHRVELYGMLLFLLLFPVIHFREAFAPGTKAETTFAFHLSCMFPGWAIPCFTCVAQLERLTYPVQMNEPVLPGSNFIPSYIPKRVHTVPSHQSCRIAT